MITPLENELIHITGVSVMIKVIKLTGSNMALN